MKQLAETISNKLSSMYGQENVYNGYAESDVAVPYVVFTIGESGETEVFAAAADANTGGRTEYPIRISCYCRTYSIACNRLEEIIEEFTTQPSVLTMPSDLVLFSSVSSREIIQEDAVEQDDEIVYRAYALINLTVNQGAT